ncbi:MAG: glutamine amidotransferase [Clostridia bacterium]
MKVKVIHLYPDLMNLYGEYGNVKVIERHLKDQGAEVEIVKLTTSDKIDLSKADFVYVGSGTEKNQLVCASHLMQYKENIKEAVERGVVILATGNAQEFFGKHIKEVNGAKHEMLGIVDITAQRTDYRTCLDVIYACDKIDAKVTGFINKMSIIKNNKNPLFKVIFGEGMSKDETIEGYVYNNLYATYVIGPILARNPKFLRHIVELICTNKSSKFKYKDIEYPYEEKGYEMVLEELTKRLNGEK